MGNNLLRDSRSVKAIIRFPGNYRSFENSMDRLYEDSFLYKKIKTCQGLFKKHLKGSFLRKITNEKTEDPGIVDGSMIFIFLTAFINRANKRVVDYSGYSEINLFIHSAKTGPHVDRLKAVSLATIAALVTNAAISISAKIEVGLLGWIMRLGLILLGMAVIFGDVGWRDAKDTSFFVRLFTKGEKS